MELHPTLLTLSEAIHSAARAATRANDPAAARLRELTGEIDRLCDRRAPSITITEGAPT